MIILCLLQELFFLVSTLLYAKFLQMAMAEQTYDVAFGALMLVAIGAVLMVGTGSVLRQELRYWRPSRNLQLRWWRP